MSLARLSRPASTADAIALQQDLRHQVKLEDDFGPVQTIAGIDVSYDKRRNLSQAVIVTMTLEELTPLCSVIAFQENPFPYIPGLLSFREIPAILEALSCLPEMPDMLFVDGQGIAHPRRLGIAAHIGVLTGIPAIGIAKSRLTGIYEEPGNYKGAIAPLWDRQERIGTILRSRENVKPLFISPGHKVSQESAVKFVLRTLTRYRLPEPTRLADKLSKVKL